MSVDAYLGPNEPRRKTPDGGVEVGQSVNAPMLDGQILPKGVDYPESVREMLRPLLEPRPPGCRIRLEDQNDVYDSVDRYDPVLLWHCRL